MPETLSSREVRELREACRDFHYWNLETRILSILLDVYEQAHGVTPPEPPIPPRATSTTEALIDSYLSQAERMGDQPTLIVLSIDRYPHILSSPEYSAEPLSDERFVGDYRGVKVTLCNGYDVIRVECAPASKESAPNPES